MRAEIITIGDELLIGQVVDTNSAWMAQRLNEVGIELYQITSVHDDREHILRALDEAFSRADIVLTTGGLGPTKDDITKHVMCEYFNTQLVEDSQVHVHILDLYKERPNVLNRLTATQWLVPESAEILPNRVGSAPIMVFHTNTIETSTPIHDQSNQETKFLVAMPGVPYEMKIAMMEQVMPYLQGKMGNEKGEIIHRTLMLYGIAESTLAILIEDWENTLPASMHLAYLPKDGVIRLRLSTYGEATESEMDAQIEAIKPLIADYLIATEDLALEQILGNLLKERQQTIATAESCTGGNIAHNITLLAGSSQYFLGGIVSYANEVKMNVLGVHKEDLEKYGAVSQAVVESMATGACKAIGSDYSVATSGIAGPGGGSEEKPVGTVWMAVSDGRKTVSKCWHFDGNREEIIEKATKTAIFMLLEIVC